MEIDKKIEENFKRFFKHIAIDETDRVLVVLKGHLLVEELLREYIKARVTNHKYLDDARLTFHQCLCIARSLSNNNDNSKLWKSIKLLNTLRNKLAHSLEPNDIDNKIDEFVNYLTMDDIKGDYMDDDKRYGVLSTCLLTVCSSLAVTINIK